MMAKGSISMKKKMSAKPAGGVIVPSRQVHLDFHTTEHMPDVGALFDKKEWQKALKAGRINSINIFAKCHHGWSYYPTKIGRHHPALKRNLLGEQIEACHEIGVNCPIYYSVGWSVQDALAHPEWRHLQVDGQPFGVMPPTAKPSDPIPTFFWSNMCPSGDYLELIKAQTAEICGLFEVDGFWYDICCYHACRCPRCVEGMRRAGLNPQDEKDATVYSIRKWQHMMRELNAIILAKWPNASIFYNGGTGTGGGALYGKEWHELSTHHDLEDLPTTWGGYDRFPIRSRYFSERPKKYTAMSGKFHTSWGEFGGFKHPDAMRYEAAAMIAFGARCNFGDQLHPCGRMEMATYKAIGEAYRYVEKIEEFGLDAKPMANLGLWLSGPVANHDQGVASMLLESQMDFRIAEAGRDLSVFDAIVLADEARLDEGAAEALRAYVRGGGALLVLGRGGMDAEGKRFLVDVGAEYVGPAEYDIDYIVAGRELARDLPEGPFLCYTAAPRVRVTDGKALAAIREPYFSRTWEHYCGHQNTPYRLENAAHPAAVQKGRVIYLPHALGEMYHAHGARVHRQFFVNALRRVYRRPNCVVAMPSGGRVSFVKQPERNRYVVHLLYGPPMPRGRCQVIEDLVPLYDVPVQIVVPEKIRRARTVTDGKRLRLTIGGDGKISVVAPKVQCHEAVVLEY